jgi:hypothetical protein
LRCRRPRSLRSALTGSVREIDYEAVAGSEQNLAADDAPGGFGINPMIERLVTDLPEPDSPTTASVSPLFKANDTSSTD